jgi:hypothetical protein
VALTAVLDACVLYSAPLRDLLLSFAEASLYRPRWTEAINDEWTRNLRNARPSLPADKIDRTRIRVNESVPDCLITGYEGLIPTLSLPDADDRHVLAAAIFGHANVIVTFNIKDFPNSSLAIFSIEAWHPDRLVTHLLNMDLTSVCSTIKLVRERLTRPAYCANAYLDNLERQGLHSSVSNLRRFVSNI